MKREFRGSCMGVMLHPRSDLPSLPLHSGEKVFDPHVIVTLLVEDDGLWHDQMTFSSYWLDELIEQLEKARDHMRKRCKPDVDNNGRQWGFRFRGRS